MPFSPSRAHLGLGPLRSRHRGAVRTDFMVRLIDDWIDRHTDNVMELGKAMEAHARAQEQALIEIWAGQR